MDTAASTDASTDRSRIEITDSLTSAQFGAARAVLAAAAEADGREAVSEAGRLRLRVDSPREGIRHVIQTHQGRPAGYAQLELADQATATATATGTGTATTAAAATTTTAELAVTPALRGQGLGRRLVDAVLAEAGPGATVDFWAHGGHPAARHLAEAYCADLVRELRQMRRTAEAPQQPPLPEGVTLRTFRPGEDEAAWLALNAQAFAHHLEQGSWSAADLAERLAEPWFEPAGFFLATRGGPEGERLVGFHWTKVHPEGLGEVYVVGVAPSEQGSGLGRALTVAGLRHLILDRKLETVMLYVDADNPAAVRVYERLGFTVHEVDLMYRVQRPKDTVR